MAGRAKRVAQRVVGAAKRAGGAAKRVTTRVVEVARSERGRRVARKVAGAAGAMALAQARILPAAGGGYLYGMVERSQRKAEEQALRNRPEGADPKSTKGAIVKDPNNRILAELAVLALAASKTSGVVREVVCGMAGGAGAMYEMYNATDGYNPDDGYTEQVRAGRSGV